MNDDNPVGYRIATEAEIEQSRRELKERSREALVAMEQNGTRAGLHPRMAAIMAAAAARKDSQSA